MAKAIVVLVIVAVVFIGHLTAREIPRKENEVTINPTEKPPIDYENIQLTAVTKLLSKLLLTILKAATSVSEDDSTGSEPLDPFTPRNNFDAIKYEQPLNDHSSNRVRRSVPLNATNGEIANRLLLKKLIPRNCLIIRVFAWIKKLYCKIIAAISRCLNKFLSASGPAHSETVYDYYLEY